MPADAPGGLLRSELRTLFGRRRTWGLLSALAAVPVLIAVAVELASSPPARGDGPPFLDQVTQNGLFVAVTAITVCLPLFLPLAVGVVAGDTVAGEASLGTLRYLLVAPAGRVRLLLVKYAAAVAFCVAAVATLALVGTLVGWAFFGAGPVTTLSGSTLSGGAGVARLALVVAHVSMSLSGLAAVGLFVSTLTEVPVGAMATTIVLAVLVQVLGGLSQLDWLHPWLLSFRWYDYADLLRDPIAWTSTGRNVLLQGGYVAFFGALAYTRFATKDVLS